MDHYPEYDCSSRKPPMFSALSATRVTRFFLRCDVSTITRLGQLGLFSGGVTFGSVPPA